MKSSYILSTTYIKDLSFPAGSVILYLQNGYILVGADYKQPRKNKLLIFVYVPSENKWVKTYAKDTYTEKMWDVRNEHQRRHRSHIKANFAQMMKHERIHKGGGGGSRIGKSQTVTDYECTKNPLHDFRRYIE